MMGDVSALGTRIVTPISMGLMRTMFSLSQIDLWLMKAMLFIDQIDFLNQIDLWTMKTMFLSDPVHEQVHFGLTYVSIHL